MASDNKDDSRQKHRMSPDELSGEESSKRRKHSHRHRHHHHSKRHRSSRKREEEATRDGEDVAPLVPPPPPVVTVASGATCLPDYDMEEGEIIEEQEEGGINNDEITKNKLDSDVESGEIQRAGTVAYPDNRDMGVKAERGMHNNIVGDEVSVDNGLSVEGTISRPCRDDRTTKLKEEVNGKTSYGHHVSKKNNDSNTDYDLFSRISPKSHVDWGTARDSCKDFKGSDKEKVYENGEAGLGLSKTKEVGDSARNRRKSLSSGSGTIEDKNSIPGFSPSQDEVYATSRSRSRDRGRERSRSQSIFQDVPLKAIHGDKSDLDYEQRIKDGKNHQHGSRDSVRNRERDRGTSYSTWDKELGRSRDREMERNRRRETERDRSGDRNKESVRGRDRSRDREMDRDRKREKDRNWSKEREMDRDSRSERERDRSRERARERETDRNRERDRKREKDRESGRDRHRDSESYDGYGSHRRNYDSRSQKQVETEYSRDRSRKSNEEKVNSSKSESSRRGEDKLQRDEDEQENYQERVVLPLEEQEEEDLNRIKEESRRRRQAILEKYKNQQLQQPLQPQSDDNGRDDEPVGQSSQPIASVTDVPKASDDKRDSPDVDVPDESFSVKKSSPRNGADIFESSKGAGGLGEGSPKGERSNDMFCDDIFGDSPAGVRKLGKGDGLPIERSGLHDNWDDAEGYYSYRFGEILDGRYEVTAAHGKGVFSTVVRAKDLKAGPGDPEEVAIKIIRNNDTMYKAGMEELVILKKLVGADPDDKRHCVRFISSFKYRNHLCLVFESLHMNLREVLKKFGRNIGLKLTAVRAYAKQLFIALKHLRNCGVLHCDIKPDNMLVNEAKNVLKLCDFGNAMFAGKNEITPYLVSRFYRAPEIILGLPYDHPLDIWSVGCCLYELYTGKVLFPGPSNNDMLRLHMELKGPFPKKMLRKGGFTDQHFDQDLNFHATEEDPVTKKTIKRLILNIKPKDISVLVKSSLGEDPKMLANFKDLLEKVFVLDPEKRMTVSQALCHPFITGK